MNTLSYESVIKDAEELLTSDIGRVLILRSGEQSSALAIQVVLMTRIAEALESIEDSLADVRIVVEVAE